MKKIFFLVCCAVVFSLALAAVVSVPTARAQVSTSYSSSSLLTQIQFLKTQLAALEQQILLRNTVVPTYTYNLNTNSCYTDIYGSRYCPVDNKNYNSINAIDRIEVDFVGNIAQVHVLFTNGDNRFYAFNARTEYEVSQLLSQELSVSSTTILGLIGNTGYTNNNYNTDINRIDVALNSRDADVTVRFRNGTIDRFTLRNINRNENTVIAEVADRYRENRRAVEDLIRFDDSTNNFNDIRRIDVDFVGNDADIFVRFRVSNTDRFTLRNVNHNQSEVIRRLAGRYDMSRTTIEDLTNFN